VKIPGCPPAPRDLLRGLLAALLPERRHAPRVPLRKRQPTVSPHDAT
jgi:Ni,Fe-hydrogenase III small subunit